ncbi:MAG: hypothetical protein WBO48_17355, partial [Candidatus Promineifilaceae bacterium]
AQSRWYRALVIGLAGSLAAYFVYGLLDTVALGAKPGFIFWMLLGVVAGSRRLTAGGETTEDTNRGEREGRGGEKSPEKNSAPSR